MALVCSKRPLREEQDSSAGSFRCSCWTHRRFTEVFLQKRVQTERTSGGQFCPFAPKHKRTDDRGDRQPDATFSTSANGGRWSTTDGASQTRTGWFLPLQPFGDDSPLLRLLVPLML